MSQTIIIKRVIPREEIEVNDKTVITDTQNLLHTESDYYSGCDTYIAFSASSVCEVEVSVPDADFDSYGRYTVERLTNEQNTIPNLYALHVWLNKYEYAQGEPQSRIVGFGLKVTECNGDSGGTAFEINQTGCERII